METLVVPESQAGPCGLSALNEGTALFSDGEINDEADMSRIIGGEKALDRMFPWQVELIGAQLCGGTLVNMQVNLLTFHHHLKYKKL